MYENGKKVNRHARMLRHKKRLKNIQWTDLTDDERKCVRQKDGCWLCQYSVRRNPYPVKWWKAIYDSHTVYNKTAKKSASRRARNFNKRQLCRYTDDMNSDYSNQDLKYKL